MAEYEPCAECKNPDVMYLCQHCGKCGRIFEDGVCVNIGWFYPVSYCPHFVKYQGQTVKTCLSENVSIFQDGYIRCSMVDSIGRQECYRRFEERMERE